MGGRLIHGIDLYTGKYGNSMFPQQMTRIIVVAKYDKIKLPGSNNMSACYNKSLVPGLRARQHFTARVHPAIFKPDKIDRGYYNGARSVFNNYSSSPNGL